VTGYRHRSASRLALWGAFLAVHGWLTFLGVVVVPGESFYDLELYRWWAQLTTAGGPAAVLSSGWVYPAGALVPMLAAASVGTGSTVSYALAWCAMVAALDAVAITALVRSGRSAGAWWWLGFLLLLGPVALGSLDAVIVPLCIVALVLVARSPAHARTASALLTVGAWIKVAPGALLLPLIAARRRPLRDVVVPAAAVTLTVVTAVLASGGIAHIGSFLTGQGTRGLQVEAVGASGWMVARLLSARVEVVFNEQLSTYEVAGPGTGVAAPVLDVILVGAVVAIGLALVLARRRGVADAALLPGSLAIMAALFVTDKVGSPQYLTWVAAPIAVALSAPGILRGSPDQARLHRSAVEPQGTPPWLSMAAGIGLAAAALTQEVFPWGYALLLDGNGAMTVVLVLRNLLLIALLVSALLGIRGVVRRDPEWVSELEDEPRPVGLRRAEA